MARQIDKDAPPEREPGVPTAPKGGRPVPSPPAPTPPSRPSPAPTTDDDGPDGPVADGPGPVVKPRVDTTRPTPRPSRPTLGTDAPWPMTANGWQLQLQFERRLVGPTWNGDRVPTLDGVSGRVMSGRSEPMLAYFVSDAVFEPYGFTRLHFVRLLDETLRSVQIYHSRAIAGSLTMPTITGEFFQFDWDGKRYRRTGPFPWTATARNRPWRLPVGGKPIEQYATPTVWTYNGNARPGFALSEWQHVENPIAAGQRQIWGVHAPFFNPPDEPDAHSVRAPSMFVGCTVNWDHARFVGEGVFYTTHAVNHCVLVPHDPGFDRFSVLRGEVRRIRTRTLLGEHGGYELRSTTSERMIDATTGRTIDFHLVDGSTSDHAEWHDLVLVDEDGRIRPQGPALPFPGTPTPSPKTPDLDDG